LSHEATVELLSRYLDGDVSAVERQRIGEWIAEDAAAREIYEGLSRVRGALGQLADAAPPNHLGVTVQRRVALEAEQAGLWSQVDRGLRRWVLTPATLPVFAVVVALGAMFYVLSHGLARSTRQHEPVFLAAPPGTVTEPESLDLAGRTLVLRRDRWVETGLTPAEIAEARRVAVPASERLAWVESRPELGRAVELGTVLMRLDGEVVELVFAPEPGADPGAP
jgi:anti-sigma factor RsiW